MFAYLYYSYTKPYIRPTLSHIYAYHTKSYTVVTPILPSLATAIIPNLKQRLYQACLQLYQAILRPLYQVMFTPTILYSIYQVIHSYDYFTKPTVYSYDYTKPYSYGYYTKPMYCTVYVQCTPVLSYTYTRTKLKLRLFYQAFSYEYTKL